MKAIEAFDIERAIKDFRAAVDSSLFDSASYAPYEQFLRMLFRPTRAPQLSDLKDYPQLAELMLPRSFFEGQPQATEAVTLLFTRRQLDNRDERAAMVEAVRGALADTPDATLTGISVVSHDLEHKVRHDLPRVVGWAMAAVVIYLVLHFRGLRAALWAMIPTVFGFVVLLAAMRLADEKFNIVNLIAIPLLAGIAVDYGVFVMSIIRPAEKEEPDASLRKLGTSVHAITICAATTVLGFGSLGSISVPAIRSLGFAMGISVAASTVATLLYAPMLLAWQRKRGKRADA